jgi:hypothetical protein
MYDWRSLLIYVACGLTLSFVSFLILLLAIYIPLIWESDLEALTPGVGLLVFLYAQVSCVVGIVAGIPATWLIDFINQRIVRRRHRDTFQDNHH